jgi:SAM-dependent methyltransferase
MHINELSLMKMIAHEGGSILDIGCGTGDQLRKLKDLGLKDLTGVDIVQYDNLKDFNFVKCDSMQYLMDNPARYDQILSRQSFYYYSADQQIPLFVAAYQALKSEGYLYLIVFNGSIVTSNFIAQKDLGIRFIYNEINLKSLGELAGFSQSDIYELRIVPKNLLKRMILNLVRSYVKYAYTFRFLSERGIDSQNPRIFSKVLVAIYKK